MKMRFVCNKKWFRFVCLIVIVPTLWMTGCATPKTDPLEGWQIIFSRDGNPVDKAIENDYQHYIDELPQREKNAVGLIHFFENKNKEHAVKIEIGLSGTDRTHILIYDTANSRIKVIKYVSGHYRS